MVNTPGYQILNVTHRGEHYEAGVTYESWFDFEGRFQFSVITTDCEVYIPKYIVRASLARFLQSNLKSSE